MARWISSTSTGYETPEATTKITVDADESNEADKFIIYSDEEMIASNPSTDKILAPTGVAMAFDERAAGSMAKSLAGLTGESARTRSRSSHAPSNGTSSVV